MTSEEKSFLDTFVESKDRTISDYNKVNTLFLAFINETPSQDEWVPLLLKLITYLRPETINTAFNSFDDINTQIGVFSEVAKDFDLVIQFAFWSSELAYCANNKTTEIKTLRDIIIHLNDIIRQANDQKELLPIFRKLCLGAIDNSSSLPNFFSIEISTNEFHAFTQFVLSSIGETSKTPDKLVLSGVMFENWFKYGVLSVDTPADTVESIINALNRIGSSYMLLTQRNMRLERQCTNQELRIETLQSTCDSLTNKNTALSSHYTRLVSEKEELSLTIKKLEDEKAGLEQLIDVIKAGNDQKSMNQKNKLADKLAVYYNDCKEAMNVEMSAEVGEVLRDTLADVFKILEESGIPLK